MTRRLAVFLVALSALGVVATGCGDDDDNGDNQAQTATTETATGPSGTETAATEADTEPRDTKTQTLGKGREAPIASGKQVVESCKKSIAAQRQLSPRLREQLDSTCDDVGSGDTARVRRASREICRTIVAETATPSNRKQALKACDKATEDR